MSRQSRSLHNYKEANELFQKRMDELLQEIGLSVVDDDDDVDEDIDHGQHNHDSS